jgi:integrase
MPVTWASPLTQDLIGSPPPKDPLREDLLPIEIRIKMVERMDCWQLCHLSLSLTLPLRPEEAAGLLISDVKFEKRWFEIGSRLGGGDYTKGHQSFKLPFAPEHRHLLVACIGGRTEGPLLRSRRAFEGKDKSTVSSFEELAVLYERKLRQSPQDAVQCEQDRKEIFRDVLRELGGISEDRMAVEFKKLLADVGLAKRATFYQLRHSTTQGLKAAGVPHLDLLYLTAHSTSGILNEYTPVDPVGSMEKYFATIRPLLAAITQRARELGLGLPEK